MGNRLAFSAMPNSLFDDDEDTGNMALGHNEDFARRYNYNKKQQELRTLKDKYGDAMESSSYEYEEDSYVSQVDEELLEKVGDVLSKVVSKDKSIYDSSVSYF